jgi:predicted Zn-dependent protease
LAIFQCANAAKAASLADRSIALMPFNAIAHGTYAGILTYLGRPREALTAFDEEARLSPRAHGQFFTLAMRAQAHVMLGELEKVLRATDAVLNNYAGYLMLPLIKAICMTALVRT